VSAVSVKEVMTESVCTVAEGSAVLEVVELMRHNNFSCVVIEKDGRPFGIVTERDVLRLTNLLLKGTKAKVGNIKVESIMTSPVMTVRSSATLHEAMLLCRDKKIRHMPVVDKTGLLAGLLTQSDLMSGYFHILESKVNPVADGADTGESIDNVDLQEVEQDLKDLFQMLQPQTITDRASKHLQ